MDATQNRIQKSHWGMHISEAATNAERTLLIFKVRVQWVSAVPFTKHSSQLGHHQIQRRWKRQPENLSSQHPSRH